MREVEIKAQLKKGNNIRLALIKQGWKPSKKVHQSDIIFIKNGCSFLDIQSGTPVMRVRIENQTTYTLNVKISQSSELDCIEHETSIGNTSEAIKILESLDLYEVIRVHKAREKGLLNGYTVCLDEVEHLGEFIEVESLLDDSEDNIVEKQADFWQLLSTLGIEKTDEITKGYDTLLYRRLNQH